MLDLETLLRVPAVDPDYGFDLAPDGRAVAFSHNATGGWEVYVLPLAAPAAPARFTDGPGAKRAPRWAPDGRRLAYLVDLDGGEEYDIWLGDAERGLHINRTPDTPYAIQPAYAWSPDGRFIGFAANPSGRFHTYMMDVQTGAACPLLSLPYHDYIVTWSPDGAWLAVIAETEGQDTDAFLVSPATGEHRLLTDAGGSPLRARDVAWSPDGSALAFSAPQGDHLALGIYDVASGQARWVAGGRADREGPAWAPDGRRLACVLNEGPTAALSVLDLENGTEAVYRVGPGIHSRPSFTPDGARLLFVFDSPHDPADLWSLDLRDGALARLTHSLPPELRDAPLVAPELVHYPAPDGRMVPALLYRPPGVAGPAPAVLLIHGGPNWISRVTWDPVVQHMVSRGWVVLAPNYRGSIGYGREWQLANRFDLGGADADDVAAGADYLIRRGLADPSRIAVTGRSYGGYLTMVCLTRFPQQWVAGSAVVPFLNWFTGHANSREDLQHWDLENFGHPERDRELYYERSPYFFLDRVQAAVQLIAGAHDPRCPASESVQACEALRAAGKRCDLALYPDEGHEFLKTDNILDAERRRISFLAEALEGGQ